MTRKPLTFSAICIAGLSALCLYTWLTLPELDRYPVHWNIKGEANGFASRTGVLGVLFMMPITQIFVAGLLHFLAKLEPLQRNLSESRGAYNAVWILTMAFLTFVGAIICYIYISKNGLDTAMFLRSITVMMSLLFIGIGNQFGKVRQNFIFGIRTPWTLSSELSWEKTHRIGSRLFVLAGVIGLLLALLKPEFAVVGIVTALLTAVLICAVYSYIIWKDDPKKRQ